MAAQVARRRGARFTVDADNRLHADGPASVAIFAAATADVVAHLGYASAAAFEAAPPEDREARLRTHG